LAVSRVQFKYIVFVLSLVLIYFITGKLALSVAFINASVSPVWVPAGISLAAFLIWGYKIWPAIFIGALLINITTTGIAATSIGIAVGNTLEGVVGAYLINRFVPDGNIFTKPINIFIYAALGAIVSVMIGATFGVTVLSLGGLVSWVNYWNVWITWWLGDLGGVIIVTPVLLLWRKYPKITWHFSRMVEAMLITILILLICQVVFVEQIPIAKSNPMVLIAPPLIWIAFRFGPRETATTILILALITILSTLGNIGPFVREDPNHGLLVVQVFMGILFITFMPLAAAAFHQKQVEEKVRENEERYRTLIETATDVIITINNESKILFCNPVVKNIFGYEPDELIGKDVMILIPDYLREAHAAGFSQYVKDKHQSRSQVVREVKGLHKNGNEIFLEVSYGEIQKNGSSIFIGFLRDVTNKRTVEEALSKVQEKFRLAVDHFPSTFVIYDTERRINFINKEGLRITGYKEEDILNKRDEEVFPPELTNNYIPLLKECIRTKTPQKKEFTVNLQNQAYTFMDYYVPVLNKEGNIDQVVGICHDVTSHKRAEETKTLLASIVESSHEAIIGKNLDGTIISWNCAAAKIYGYKVEEAIGKNIAFIIPDERKHEIEEFHRKVVLGEKIQQHESMRVRKDGTKFYVSLTISPIRDSYGKIAGASIIEHDITEQKIASLQLKNSLKEKEILLKEIHHRVKNNLQIVSSLLNLQANCIDDKKALSVFVECQNRIRAMALVHEKLYQTKDFARIDFNGYVRDLVANLFQSYAVNTYQTNFYQYIDDIYINVDTIITLGLIINELVTNSIKHAFVNMVQGGIFVSFFRKDKNSLSLSVADTGRGLPENFDINNTESLGLRLVTTLVDQLNGSIETKVNKGTEFVITFSP
jgi:PAS domain S-box-containing protein